MVTAPVSGLLMDRFGPRRIAIPGVFLYGIGMAAFALINRSLLQYYATFVLLSIAFLGLKPLTWTGAVAKVFIETRALAFAVAISGIAIAGAIVPSITNYLVQHYGWRGALRVRARLLIWTVAVLPCCSVVAAQPRTIGGCGRNIGRDAAAVPPSVSASAGRCAHRSSHGSPFSASSSRSAFLP